VRSCDFCRNRLLYCTAPLARGRETIRFDMVIRKPEQHKGGTDATYVDMA
jgi:hypothetical protein